MPAAPGCFSGAGSVLPVERAISFAPGRQRALVLDAKPLQDVLGAVEIDIAYDQIRALLDFLDDWPLLLASRTPWCGHIDENGFSGGLGGLKCLGVERLPRPSDGRQHQNRRNWQCLIDFRKT
jgi:hypothetical protein